LRAFLTGLGPFRKRPKDRFGGAAQYFLDPSGRFQGYRVQIPVNAFALLDLAGSDRSIGSLVWSGRVTNSGPTAATLTVGGDNSSTTFDGTIENGVAVTALTKVGTGTTNLTGTSTYTGSTKVNGGVVAVNGSIASSLLTTVNAGGTLGGNGTVGNTTINGGALAPGNSIGTLTVAGNLIFTAAASLCNCG
jgi:autotransporter-associated beta strand protein